VRKNNPALLDQLEDEIPHLRRYARSLCHDPERADDLVQDCLERAISRANQFQPGTDLRRWLFTILKHGFIDIRRANARRGIHVPLEDWSSSASHKPEQPSHLEARDVLEAIDHLRREERDVIDFVVFKGMRYRDVSSKLHVAVGTIKSRLARARHSLAEITHHAA
jgi:RNA polymerase sigma-70 factor (ECF subfamily)